MQRSHGHYISTSFRQVRALHWRLADGPISSSAGSYLALQELVTPRPLQAPRSLCGEKGSNAGRPGNGKRGGRGRDGRSLPVPPSSGNPGKDAQAHRRGGSRASFAWGLPVLRAKRPTKRRHPAPHSSLSGHRQPRLDVPHSFETGRREEKFQAVELSPKDDEEALTAAKGLI